MKLRAAHSSTCVGSFDLTTTTETSIRGGVHFFRASLLAAMSLVLLASSAAALPACLESCRDVSDCCAVEPCLDEPCALVRAEEASLREELDTCIATCPATSPGRCTILLGCVRKCQSFFRTDMKRVVKDAFATTTCPDCRIKGPKAQRAAVRACGGCTSVTTTTTATTSTSTPASTSTVTTTSVAGSTVTSTTATTVPERPDPPEDRCQAACIQRITSLRGCYRRCRGACEGNERAEPICQGVCRNSVCLAIKARCAWDPETPTPEDVDPQYRACCTRQGTCVARGDTTVCEITTSTTTTTTSTTSSSSTTSSTTTTTLVTIP